MALIDDLERIATAAARHRAEGSTVSAVLAAEPAPGLRRYLCAFEDVEGGRTWIVLDDDGAPVTDRRDVRDAIAISALCEIAEESAGGGDLDELLSQLVALRLTEAPDGIDEAEDAVRELQLVDRLAAGARLALPPRRHRRRHPQARAGARCHGTVAVHGSVEVCARRRRRAHT